MATRRIIVTFTVLGLGMIGLLAVLAGCESTPAEPEFQNVFDLDVNGGANPFELTATVSGSTILLSWTQRDGYGISYYELSHSFNFFSDFLPIGSVDHTGTGTSSFIYSNAAPTRTHYFRIQAFDNAGNFTRVSEQVPVSRVTPPLLALAGGGTAVASRQITLAVTVSSGDSLRISHDPEFAEEVRVAVVEAGQPQTIPWTLPLVEDNDAAPKVRVLAMTGSALSDTAVLSLNVDFSPDFTVPGSPSALATRHLDLVIPVTGVVEMRFADSEENLALQAWAPADTTAPFELADSANPQTIWGEFVGDFGFNAITSLEVTPDLLDQVGFAFDVGDDHLTDESLITVLADAAATEMRISESLNFGGAAWIPYAEEVRIFLGAAPGRRDFYCQFRNDWAQSDILTDYVIYLTQPLEVAITAPEEGDLVPSGLSLLVRGTAIAAAGTAVVDSVKFDPGDGSGFLRAEGAENWTFNWAIPAVAEETARVIRARAWADGDSVTTSLSVTLQPEVEIE